MGSVDADRSRRPFGVGRFAFSGVESSPLGPSPSPASPLAPSPLLAQLVEVLLQHLLILQDLPEQQLQLVRAAALRASPEQLPAQQRSRPRG
ncbi:MAG: hypothetical protein IPG04_38545 [Polyangiaceae bacterium]|nr:hypothetical protein [Polyangiaceae bacterium]